ncbi:MAG: right-handed parallel beta-helix repeat-containing protein [Bacteroidota bacterium]
MLKIVRTQLSGKSRKVAWEGCGKSSVLNRSYGFLPGAASPHSSVRIYMILLAMLTVMSACDWNPLLEEEDSPVPQQAEVFKTPVHEDLLGPGTNIRPGRNGDVYTVTNLNKNGKGSLRYGVETARGPRTIIFATSGKIKDGDPLSIKANNVRIAGMTAPWPGIVYEGSIRIWSKDVMIEYLTVLVGTSTNKAEDALTIFGTGNYVFYRCLFAWSRDETIDIVNQVNGVTYKHCIISESLDNKDHAFGGLFHANKGRVLLDGNLFSHHAGRMPMSRIKELYIANNIFYDRSGRFVELYNQNGLRTKNMIVDNIFQEGPSRPRQLNSKVVHSNKTSLFDGTKIYIHGNRWSANQKNFKSPREEYQAYISNFPSGDFGANSPLFSITGRNRMSVDKTESYVLSNVGPFPGNRFKIAQRIVDNYWRKKGKVIDSPSQVGGTPSVPVNKRKLDVPANPHRKDNNGYTRLENWLSSFY